MNDKDIGLLIKKLTDRIKFSVDALLSEHDLTFSQTLVLGYLSERGGRVTQKEIEEHLQVSHPTVVGIISRLESKGFITGFKDEKDRRNKIVCATEKALSMVDVMREDRAKMERKLTKGLSEAEIAEFRRIINILINNF